MTEWSLYWITRLDGVRDGVIGIFTIGIICTAALLLVYIVAEDNRDTDVIKKAAKWLKIAVPITVLVGVIVAFMPTTKEALVIYGGPKILNSKFVREDAEEIGELGVEYLKKILKEK